MLKALSFFDPMQCAVQLHINNHFNRGERFQYSRRRRYPYMPDLHDAIESFIDFHLGHRASDYIYYLNDVVGGEHIRPITYVRSYANVEYNEGEVNYDAYLFPEAVAQLYQPNQSIVFVSESLGDSADNRERSNFRALEHIFHRRMERVSRDRERPEIQLVPIPDGKSTDELWKTFEPYSEVVDTGDEVILDISNGFRSYPILAFTIAAYLCQVKDVKLKHIVYGAFEARDSQGRVPIFDLAPFTNLLDSMNAINTFQYSGDARLIAKLENMPTNISDVLKRLSEGLLYNLPLEAQQAAYDLQSSSVLGEPPLVKLVEELKKTYQAMSVRNPSNDLVASLKAQQFQIEWYIQNQHYLQAITLIREWLISWLCHKERETYWRNYKKRKRLVNKSQKPSNALFEKCWRNSAKYRNFYAHCGINDDKNKEVVQIESLIKLVEELSENIKLLSKQL